jgi:hypothetical protein
MTSMLLTILKIVAGVAVLGIVALVLMAVISGLRESVGSLRRPEEKNEDPRDG